MAKIHFENGVTVNFDGNPTPQDVEEVAQKLNIHNYQGIVPSENKSLVQKTADISGKILQTGGNIIGGNIIPATLSVIGSGIESGAKLLGKNIGNKFTQEAQKRLAPNLTGLGTVAGSALEAASLGVGKELVSKVVEIAKTPLTKVAEKLYQSALKPRGKLLEKGAELAQTGLKERIFLTSGGVEKVANKIDDLENTLGSQIQEAAKNGVKISTDGLQKYLDEAKKFFSSDFDVERAKKAIEEIDSIGKSFIQKYGKEIPIDIAQEIKVKTGQRLRKYYGELTGAAVEGTKQGTRFLKEKIVEQLPGVGGVNARLKSLYEFDQALSKAGGRIKNLNLLGISSKIGGAVAGVHGAIIGKLLEVVDMPVIKSGLAIGINELTRGTGGIIKGARVPVSLLVANLIRVLQQEQQKQNPENTRSLKLRQP